MKGSAVSELATEAQEVLEVLSSPECLPELLLEPMSIRKGGVRSTREESGIG